MSQLCFFNSVAETNTFINFVLFCGGKNVRIARCELRITSFIISNYEIKARNCVEKAQNCEI